MHLRAAPFSGKPFAFWNRGLAGYPADPQRVYHNKLSIARFSGGVKATTANFNEFVNFTTGDFTFAAVSGTIAAV